MHAILASLLLLGMPLHAEVLIESGPERVALLELYTSEGCSSCPPAERWLSGLKQDPALWTKVVPLAFHVDYWDYIGWKDRFARPEFGARQRAYANEGGVRTVYTPGFLLDGKEWRGWISGRPPLAESRNAGQLTVRVDEDALRIEFTPGGGTASGYTAYVALLAFEQSSVVVAGENKGRTLTNDFVVLHLREETLQKHGDVYSLENRVTDTDLNTAPAAIAVWVTTNAALSPLQAAGGWLDTP